MHDQFLIHELGARRVHWRYDDPSGLPEHDTRAVRAAGRPVLPATESRFRIRRSGAPKAA
jgi:hypothetical protein